MAAVIDLNGMLDQIRTVVDACNTTGANPVNLSSNMSRSVVGIFTLNPYEIPIQASQYPCVTCWVDSKTIDVPGGTIAVNQLNAQRKAKITIKIAGICWNDLVTDVKQDAAAKDAYYLMENIELILRAYPTLGTTANWQSATAVTYHEIVIGENSALKAGILDLQCTVFY